MKKLLIQIDVKNELPEEEKYYHTNNGTVYFHVHPEKRWNHDEDIKFWYKEVDERTYKIELLESYSKYLEKEEYMDIDWRTEKPFVIDEFLK